MILSLNSSSILLSTGEISFLECNILRTEDLVEMSQDFRSPNIPILSFRKKFHIGLGIFLTTGPEKRLPETRNMKDLFLVAEPTSFLASQVINLLPAAAGTVKVDFHLYS